MTAIHSYCTNWGSFEIPPDVPSFAFRKDGWFDKRYKIHRQLQQYMSDMENNMRDDRPILTWKDWNARAKHAS